VEDIFEKIANRISRSTGRPLTFLICCALVIVWAASGPVFHFSDTWQLVINTGTTIITFLMVFLIQNSQNREGEALQAKLDEIIRALDKAENRFIGLERHSEKDIAEARANCEADAEDSTGLQPAHAATGGNKALFG
jgi:low affinity Fe/Cu permease